MVGLTGVEQLLGQGLIVTQALHLEERPFIRLKAEPAQPFENLFDGLARGTRGVGVLDAQYKGPAMALREQPVKQSRSRPAYVKEAGGAGREALQRGIGVG